MAAAVASVSSLTVLRRPLPQGPEWGGSRVGHPRVHRVVVREDRWVVAGALSAKYNATEEIFRIAVIMNGFFLIGVEVGFVLLRIKASVEKAQ